MIFEFISMLFTKTLELFRLEYPAMGMSFLGIAVGAILVVFSISVLGSLLGFHFSMPIKREGKGGNNKKIKVSEERKGDAK